MSRTERLFVTYVSSMSDTPPPPPPSYGSTPPPPSYGSTPPPPPQFGDATGTPWAAAGQPSMPGGPPPTFPGGPPPYQGNPYGAQPMPPFATGQTSTGTAAMVLGIVGIFTFIVGIPSILAIIFGFKGLKRIKRSGGQVTGRGKAMTGVILGIIGVLAAVGFWIFAATNNKTSLSDIKAGDCVEVPTGTIRIGLVKQSCSSPHQGEVFAAQSFQTPGSYPGDSEAQRQVGEACQAEFQSYVGTPPDGSSQFGIFVIYPTKAVWEGSGSTRIVCIAENKDGSLLTTQVKDSNS